MDGTSLHPNQPTLKGVGETVGYDAPGGVIFIVDDEPMVTTSLKTMLDIQTEYEVHAFNSPKAALHALQQTTPELVISDFLMPEMDGIQFLSRIKAVFPSTTLILLTGYADKESAIKAINEAGIYRYIEKPWDNEQLKLTIKNGVERSRLLSDIAQRKEIERLREDFVSTLTHDLRTPLLAAIQTLGFFTDGSLGPMSEKQGDIMAVLIQSLRDMLGMVNALLEVYKYESGRQRLLCDTVKLQDLVASIIRELSGLAAQKEKTITLAAESWPDVFVDKQELKRVLVNLIGNAMNHTPPGSQITVQARVLPETRFLQVEVRDNGHGIPKADTLKLFQRFSQGTSQKRTSGTGLGLYLSRQIIEAHGGEIGVESTEGQGTCFFFTLPLAEGGVV